MGARARVSGLLLAVATPAAAMLRITTPAEGDLLYGPTVVEVQADARVARVTFHLDPYPRPICEATAPPFTCTFDAGTDFQGRSIRARAFDARGTVLGEATVETLSFPAPEVVRRRTLTVPVVSRAPIAELLDLSTSNLACFFAGDSCRVVSVTKLAEKNAFPVSLEVLVDVSMSMDNDREELLRALETVLDSAPVAVEVATTEFSSTTIRLNDFTSDKEVLRQAVGRLGRGSGTCLVDAMLGSLDRLQVAPGHRLLFVISDGCENCRKARSALSYTDWLYDVVSRAREVSAPIYIYRFERLEDIDERRSSFAVAYEGVARESGGRLFGQGSIQTVGTALAALVEDLQSTWLVDLDLPFVFKPGWKRRLILELPEGHTARLHYPEYWEAEHEEDTWIASMFSPDARARLWTANRVQGTTSARLLKSLVRAYRHEPEAEIRALEIVAIRESSARLLLHGTEHDQASAVEALETLHAIDPALLKPLAPVLAVFPKTEASAGLIRRVLRLGSS